jgi:hypothetical protein
MLTRDQLDEVIQEFRSARDFVSNCRKRLDSQFTLLRHLYESR